MENSAVGIHAFAGGFTEGVQRVFPVQCQLESHDLGIHTAAQRVRVFQRPAAEWPRSHATLVYGNPRCAAFSNMSCGCAENARGPQAHSTSDIYELCEYGSAVDADFIVFESVQAAYTVGRTLINHLIETYFKNYRVAHVFINTATFNNAQRRKRYFFVAYKDRYKFNIDVPELSPRATVLYDIIYEDKYNVTFEWDQRSKYGPNHYMQLTDDEKACVTELPTGWTLNLLAKYREDLLSNHYQKVWRYRTSDIPFGITACRRLSWFLPCNVLHGACSRYIHPEFNRPITIGEAAKIMGWASIPMGRKPYEQIAKGVVPAAGKWIAEQCMYALNGDWGQDDWESSFNGETGEWKGARSSAKEKVFDATAYYSKTIRKDEYDISDACFRRVDLAGGSTQFVKERNYIK